jgi:GT2 family glycosyltransferase
VVVDNGSHDRTREIARSVESDFRRLAVELTVIEEHRNTGFTSGANRGLEVLLQEEPDFAVLLNQDATIDPEWCGAVATVLETEPRAGAVGSKILLPNRLTIQHAGGYLEKPRLMGRHYGHHLGDTSFDFGRRRDVEYVTAAGMALRATTLREIGLFDELFSPGYYEDVDWCTRARAAGWKVVYEPRAVATHVEPASFHLRPDRLNLFHRNRLLYALPSLVDDSFRREFVEAERRYANQGGAVDERRAMRMAYLWVVLVLPELAATGRIPATSPHSPAFVPQLIEMFGDLRRELKAV